MPVHRLDGTPKARIFAYKDEIDRWLEEKLREREPGPAKGEASGLRKVIVLALAALSIMAVALLLWRYISSSGGLGGPLTIAVLPFTDLSPAKDQAAWCEGIAEAILNALASVKGLQVRNRFSSFLLTAQDDPGRVGRELSVERLLTGSLQRMEDSFRIIVKLFDDQRGILLWSEKYDRKDKDIFLVQDEIARAVLEILKVERPGDKSKPIVRIETGDLGAYNMYLLGRHFWDKRGLNNMLKSVEYFQQAIAIDPQYALAYVGLSDVYSILADNLYLSPHEGYPKAREFTRKALEIDGGLADALASLAFIKLDNEWDFSGAEKDFKKVLAMSPDNARTRHHYGALLSVLGRHDEALKEVKLARNMDPLAPRLRAAAGHFLYFARKYEQALEELLNARDFDPTHAATYYFLGNVYREMGRYEESVAQLKTGLGFDARWPMLRTALAITQARAGAVDESRQVLAELKERSRTEYISAAHLAAVHTALGEKELAFGLLERAFIERDTLLIRLNTDPVFDPLRPDPLFAALLKKIGLQR